MSSENLGPRFSSVRNQSLCSFHSIFSLHWLSITLMLFPMPLLKECELKYMTDCKLYTWKDFSCNRWLTENEHKNEQPKKRPTFDDMYLFSRLRLKSPYFNSTSPRHRVGIINCPIKFMVSLTRPNSHILMKEITWQFLSDNLPALLISWQGEVTPQKWIIYSVTGLIGNWVLGWIPIPLGWDFKTHVLLGGGFWNPRENTLHHYKDG